METDAYLQTQGPFHNWPSSLLEDLYTILCRKRCTSSHLNILIQPQIRKLKIQPGSIHYAINFLQKRCPRLQCLELTGSVDIIPEFFISVFASFPHLVKINLSGNVIDERSFETIGTTCHNLVVLNVSGSTVSDCGLKFLSRSNQNIPRCQQLQHINLLRTRVSKTGVGSFLYYHPLLSDLLYDDTIGALAELESLGCGGLKQYKIKVLSCHSNRDINEEFGSAVDENPEYKGIEIVDSFLRSTSLYPVMNSQHLQYLQIGNDDSFLIDFEEGIAPILSSCGGGLKKLVLDKFRYVDIEFIGNNCKKLENFGLSHIISYGQLMNLCEDHFCNLEELQVTNEYGSHIISNILRQLLLFCFNLQYLHLQQVDCLDDMIWTQITCQNTFTNLISVTLDQCHSISGDNMKDLIDQPNSLQILNIWSCRFITTVDKESIKKTILVENFEICFRCLPFMGFVNLPLPPVDIGNWEQEDQLELDMEEVDM